MKRPARVIEYWTRPRTSCNPRTHEVLVLKIELALLCALPLEAKLIDLEAQQYQELRIIAHRLFMV